MNSVFYKIQKLALRGLSQTRLDRNRTFTTSAACRLKEIVHTEKNEGKTLIVEGKYVKSPRETFLVGSKEPCQGTEVQLTVRLNEAPDQKQQCSLCKLGLGVKHTDVLILQQFLDPFGKIMQRRVTGLCKTQQRRINYLVNMAKMAGILKTPLDKEPKRRYGFMRYNKYYDESVIDEFIFGRRKKA